MTDYNEKIRILTDMAKGKTLLVALKQQHDELMEMATCIGSPSCGDDVRVSTSRTSTDAGYTKYVEKAVGLENHMWCIYRDYLETYERVMDACGKLWSTYQLILIKRYFQEESWDDIAADLFMDRKTIMKHHRKAVEELDI